jgi:hypothetical protein
MKKLNLLTLIIGSCMFLLLESCNKDEEILDPCANVTCQNGGDCNDGSCDCPEGFSGVNCEYDIFANKRVQLFPLNFNFMLFKFIKFK